MMAEPGHSGPASADPNDGPGSGTRAFRNYRWPTPPYAVFPDDLDQIEAEPCEVVSREGQRASGRLTFFQPDRRVFVFQRGHSPTTETTRFEDIRQLRLPQPLRLHPRAPALEGIAAVAPQPQTFTLEFSDGEKLVGATLGHVNEPFGLFLFPPMSSPGPGLVAVERLFVPRHAVKSFQPGPYLGEMLVEQKLAGEEDIRKALETQRSLRDQRIGDYLVENRIVSAEDLLQAIRRQQSMPVMRLGEALIELGLLTEEQLGEALEKQRANRSKMLGSILVDMGVITEDQLQRVLARKLGFPVVDLRDYPVDREALQIVPQGIAYRLRIMPLAARDGMLVVALENPLHTDKTNELRFLSQLKVVPVIASKEQIEDAIMRHYGDRSIQWQGLNDRVTEPKATPDIVLEPLNLPASGERADINELAIALDGSDALEPEEPQIQESDNTLVRLVNTMILDAWQQQASDIHIESYPERQKTRVRFRKDGTLVPYLELPHSYRAAMLARIKIMADLDMTERRKPQDGKIDFQRFGPARIELRVATIPTTRGLEDAVLRILASAKPVPLTQLALSAPNLEHIRRLMTRAYGLFLVCGPTGSGKTTTLHSCLSYINVPERKIWTAEDPVEITQPGLRQVQVNPKIGWTFAGALRAFLRADPDVIMVGEMRDPETAKVGIEASLTGHLVLSTLHTNSAPESVTRLLDLGVDPFNFADCLLGVLGQRLAKKLCPACRRPHEATQAQVDELLEDYCFAMPEEVTFTREAVLERWHREHGEILTLHRAAGCRECAGTGYKGRIALHELLVVTPQVKRLIQTKGTIEALQHTALRQGMRTLKQDGIDKILQGETDLAQVRAVSN